VTRVTLIPGDGIGPEVSDVARRVLDASGAELDWDVQMLRGADGAQPGMARLRAALASIEESRVALKGPLTTEAGSGSRSLNIELRRRLDLFAQARICRSYDGANGRFQNVDLVVIRETTEDLYAGIEYESGSADALELIDWLAQHSAPRLHPSSGISIKPLSEFAAGRIFEFAFDYARRHGRRKVTAVHKATVMKFSDGLFLSVAREVARRHPDIPFEDELIDSLAMKLVRRPEEFDVLVMPNLYGDIVADLGAGLVGSVGIVAGANFSNDAAMFEPAHGSAPRHAGTDRANPLAMILSGSMLLRHIGDGDAADRIEHAVRETLAAGDVTYDLKPSREDPTALGTREVGAAVIRRLA
jgi:isocitrate dehydrogenase (NAD+)